MKHLFLAILAAGMAFSAAADDKVVIPDSTGFKFTDVKVIKSTPVKDQNKSGTCWCYSTNSFFENEILRKTGKEVHLSEGFVVWHCYFDKAQKFIRMDGKINFAEGGAAEDVPYVWNRYGMMPNEAYTGMTHGDKKFNTAELTAVLSGFLDVVNSKKLKKLTPSWLEGFQGVLNAYMGKIPENFTYEGKNYTPQTFAASLGINMDDYISIASFTHHPFYKPFTLEVADNWTWAQYQNVPVDELLEVANYAIDHGYTIAWGADVSEEGFSRRAGKNKCVATVPDTKQAAGVGSDQSRWTGEKEGAKISGADGAGEKVITQEMRQLAYDNWETTDDHGMQIYGIAKDQNGKEYFMMKNSWGEYGPYKGFWYVSKPYAAYKTMNIVINKNAIPADIRAKLGI